VGVCVCARVYISIIYKSKAKGDAESASTGRFYRRPFGNQREKSLWG